MLHHLMPQCHSCEVSGICCLPAQTLRPSSTIAQATGWGSSLTSPRNRRKLFQVQEVGLDNLLALALVLPRLTVRGRQTAVSQKMGFQYCKQLGQRDTTKRPRLEARVTERCKSKLPSHPTAASNNKAGNNTSPTPWKVCLRRRALKRFPLDTGRLLPDAAGTSAIALANALPCGPGPLPLLAQVSCIDV